MFVCASSRTIVARLSANGFGNGIVTMRPSTQGRNTEEMTEAENSKMGRTLGGGVRSPNELRALRCVALPQDALKARPDDSVV